MDMNTTTYQISRLANPGNGAHYHVHSATCGDANKRRYSETDKVEATTLAELAAWVYGVSTDDATENGYTDDLKVFPCAELEN